MALPDFPEIEIRPVGSGTATLAIDSQHQLQVDDQFGKIYVNPAMLTATPANGWVFDHFEWTFDIYNYNTGQTATYTRTSEANPFNSNYYDFYDAYQDPPYEKQYRDGDMFMCDGPWEGPIIVKPGGGTMQYYFYSKHTVKSIVAVFKLSPYGTGLLIYDPSSGKLMSNQKNGTLMYDDGTVDNE